MRIWDQLSQFNEALKQNLKIKTFVGTSENAIHIQIWTALIAMLLVKYLQFKSKFGRSLRTWGRSFDGTYLLTVTYGSGSISRSMYPPYNPNLSNTDFLYPALDSTFDQ